MMKNLFAAGLIAAVPAFAAQAEEVPLQFSGIELGYLSAESDNADGDGYSFKANFGLTDLIYGTLAYNTRELENGGVSVDIEQINVGAGVKFALSESGKVLAYGGVTYEMLELDGAASGGVNPGGGNGGGDGGDGGDDGGTTGTPLDAVLDPLCEILGCKSGSMTKAFGANGLGDTSGYGAHAGIRAEVFPNVEVGASYQYRVYDDEFPSGEDTETVLGLTAGYRFGSWAAVLSWNDYDELDFDEYGLALRWEFGRD